MDWADAVAVIASKFPGVDPWGLTRADLDWWIERARWLAKAGA